MQCSHYLKRKQFKRLNFKFSSELQVVVVVVVAISAIGVMACLRCWRGGGWLRCIFILLLRLPLFPSWYILVHLPWRAFGLHSGHSPSHFTDASDDVTTKQVAVNKVFQLLMCLWILKYDNKFQEFVGTFFYSYFFLNTW